MCTPLFRSTIVADTLEGSRCSILFLDFSQDPNGRRRVAPATPRRFTKPQPYPADASRLAALRRLDRLAVDDAAAIAASGARGGGAQDASASARAASSAKKTSDSRDGGRISRNEDRMDAALRAAISTMGDGVRAGRSSSL